MGKRSQHKQDNRRIKKRWLVLFTFALSMLLLMGFATFQYISGKNNASNKNDETKLEDIQFNGERDDQGRVNVLLIGIDKREGDAQSHSDTMMIAQYDTKADHAKIISLMRDIYVPIPGYDDYKINTAFYLGGPELLRETIKENFDIDVQYYMMIDFKGFENAIDTLATNGIEIDVESAMSKNIGVSLKPGLQKLNGKELLGYARFRYDSESDFGRVRRQQQVIKAVLDEVVSANGVVKAPRLLGSIQPYVQTNISKLDSLGLLKELLFFDTKNIETLSIPIEDSYEDEKIPNKGLVLKIDQEANRKAIEEFLNK